MLIIALGLFSGCFIYQSQSSVPDALWLWLLPLVVPSLWIKYLRFPAAIVLGFLWTHAWILADRSEYLAPEIEGEKITVEGEIIDLPQKTAY